MTFRKLRHHGAISFRSGFAGLQPRYPRGEGRDGLDFVADEIKQRVIQLTELGLGHKPLSDIAQTRHKIGRKQLRHQQIALLVIFRF